MYIQLIIFRIYSFHPNRKSILLFRMYQKSNHAFNKFHFKTINLFDGYFLNPKSIN